MVGLSHEYCNRPSVDCLLQVHVDGDLLPYADWSCRRCTVKLSVLTVVSCFHRRSLPDQCYLRKLDRLSGGEGLIVASALLFAQSITISCFTISSSLYSVSVYSQRLLRHTSHPPFLPVPRLPAYLASRARPLRVSSTILPFGRVPVS